MQSLGLFLNVDRHWQTALGICAKLIYYAFTKRLWDLFFPTQTRAGINSSCEIFKDSVKGKLTLNSQKRLSSNEDMGEPVLSRQLI